MKKEQPFTSGISNAEHLKRVQEVYDTEVRPFLEENRKAYELYLKGKKTLLLTPTQKASTQCQSPV